MKKRFLSIICALTAAVSVCTMVTGCLGDGTDGGQTEFTIQYVDEAGVHTLNVTDGLLYSLETLPVKAGYEFIGMYDTEVGGTQYVAASGASLAPFNDKKNIVLYPRFKAKEYTVVLDYQGAPVTGERQFTVSYGVSLPDLPLDLIGEHKEFTGWYTKPDCGGVQVADEYGLIPLVSVINEKNFDLEAVIKLYAGFETDKYTVTVCFGDDIENEEMKIAYNTPVSKIVPETRVDGKAVLTFSKTQGGEAFNGKITTDTVLYAKEYAPVIEFDENGGEKVDFIVARAGATVALPTTTRDMYKFAYWEDLNGEKYTSTRMPENSVFLKAVWKAKLIFDENGGLDVDDISVEAGERITLPLPKRDGYLFAGWFTSDGEKYTSTKMPAAGITVKAGWYKAKTEKIIIRSAEDGAIKSDWTSGQGGGFGPRASWRYELDLSKYLPESGGYIHITFNLKMCNSYSSSISEGGYYLYDGSIISDSNFLCKLGDTISTTTYRSYTFDADLNMRSNILYCCYYMVKTDATSSAANAVFYDIWAELEYPDTSNLYL